MMVFSGVAQAGTSAVIDASGGILDRLFKVVSIAIGLGALALIVWIGLLLFPDSLTPGTGCFAEGGLLGCAWGWIGIPQAADPISTAAANNWSLISAGLAALFPAIRPLTYLRNE
jgi:hypothetical protein